MYSYGIIFAIIAMICWAFGDFFIQKTSRQYGVWTSLFSIVFLGAVALFPFAIKDIPVIMNSVHLPILVIFSLATCVVALVGFKAFQVGKMVVVEPIMSFELPLTVMLGVVILKESLTPFQIVLIAVAFLGVLLTSSKNIFRTKISLEQGVFWAMGATLLMAFVNFTTGLASQRVGAIGAIWFMNVLLTIICVVYFSVTRSWVRVIGNIKRHPKESLLVSVFDNGAWLAYSASVIIIPISLAITISEGYIALAMILGVLINKERLSRLQWIGGGMSFIAVIVLAFISG